jgi:hypothetical protein
MRDQASGLRFLARAQRSDVARGEGARIVVVTGTEASVGKTRLAVLAARAAAELGTAAVVVGAAAAGPAPHEVDTRLPVRALSAEDGATPGGEPEALPDAEPADAPRDAMAGLVTIGEEPATLFAVEARSATPALALADPWVRGAGLVLVDAGAMSREHALGYAELADEVFIVIRGNDDDLAGAYSALKRLSGLPRVPRTALAMLGAPEGDAAEGAGLRLIDASGRFLRLKPRWLGVLPPLPRDASAPPSLPLHAVLRALATGRPVRTRGLRAAHEALAPGSAGAAE